jgi:hypothetical protein
MAYRHNNRDVVICYSDPIDPDSTDWVFFSYQNWKRPFETITENKALITGGTVVTDSVFIGDVVDSLGNIYTDTYGVEFSVTAGATQVAITHRVDSSVSGSPNLGRTHIDHTAIIQVKPL